MLNFLYTKLTPHQKRVDKDLRMSFQNNNQHRPPVDAGQPNKGDRGSGSHTSTRVAHELANLLDGSLRNVELVISTLKESSSLGDNHQPADGQDVLGRLQVANHAMREMAVLIRHWRHQPPVAGHDATQTLGHAVEHAVKLFMPAASAQQIEITINLSEQATRLPAGPVYTVVTNAVRNSIPPSLLEARRDRQSPQRRWDALGP